MPMNSRLLAALLVVGVCACGSPTTPTDAGLDAGTADAGADSGSPDSGSPDAGRPDGGSTANGGDTCAQALDVTAGGTFQGSTEAATDDYGPMGAGCPTGGAASGREVTYRVSPATATTYRVQVTPDAATPSFDPMLYAVLTCGGSGCVAGTVLNGPGEPEEITFPVTAGQTIYVVVDGELASRGRFTLTVSAQ